MRRFPTVMGRLSILLLLAAPLAAEEVRLRPPSVPLVAHDPYFSIWSPADQLSGADTTHWTGKPHRLTSLVRIDGRTYRALGGEPSGTAAQGYRALGQVPAAANVLPQTGVSVLPTRTMATFAGGGIALTMTFLTPALPEDLNVLSRPVTYLTYEFRSTDGRPHDVVVYFDAAAEIAVNEPKQPVEWTSPAMPGLDVLRVGSTEQKVLAKRGDDIRIDWGYFYVAVPQAQKAGVAIAPLARARDDFAYFGRLLPGCDPIAGAFEAAAAPVGVVTFTLNKVGSQPVARWLMLAYDDLYSIQYMKQNLRPYWRRNGWEAVDLLKAAAADYQPLLKRCTALDAELMADLARAGGQQYALLGALAYRQCFAAGKFVADAHGQPLSFCKENHSNGCISTSDVFYPMAPQFLLLGPSLTKSFLVPFMNYAASPRWKFPFAPHDLGQYPHANGQRDGGGERNEKNQMPVEESGNMLILVAALAQMEGHTRFADLYWPQLTAWAEYLRDKGFDPENQLCTDDFAGHLAHNVNLSAKAICGLGAYAKLCRMRGEATKADAFAKLAKEYAARWIKTADDGQKFRLAFDKPGTWSQKYNLVWDRILGLNLFPAAVLRKEMDFYKKTQNDFGLPLDNRSKYTKLDWTLWTATLTQDRGDFDALVRPLLRFLNETPDRSPMTDWYFTHDARKRGFTARPVVGGLFLQMLYDQGVWQKYAGRDRTQAADFAPMPETPITTIVVATAREEDKIQWRYTTQKPAEGWFRPGFDDAAWKQGPAGFGAGKPPGSVIRTEWKTPDIWLRRPFELPKGQGGQWQLVVHHDEDVEIYINGVLAASASGFVHDYEELALSDPAQAALQPGKNLLSVHCHQTTGGQYVDVGIAEVVLPKKGR